MTAFTRLDARAAGLGLDAKSVLQLAGVPTAAEVLSKWLARRAGPVGVCR